MTASNFGASDAACLRMWACSPSTSPKKRAWASWLTLFGPIPRMEAWEEYHARFSFDDAKNATPAPASVIFEVEDMYQNRFGWPLRAAMSSTFGFAGNSSVRVWIAYALSHTMRKSSAAVSIAASFSTTSGENVIPSTYAPTPEMMERIRINVGKASVIGRLVSEDQRSALIQLELLEQTDGAPIRVWLKIDSGMHRLGFPPEHVREVHARLCEARGVHGDIVLMTHFASSDEFDPHARSGAQTPAQLRVFAAATEDLPGPRSLANSAAVLGWNESHGDWIRPGGALYGMSVVAGRPGAEFGLRPAMTFETRLLAVNRLRKGDRVGYSATWEAPEDLLLGVAAVGYGDGYPRLAPAGTPVLVNGQAASVVGRVSMDLMTIDLRGVDGVRAGDPVTLWGPALPVETVAEAAGTISYALTCGITRRVRFVNA